MKVLLTTGLYPPEIGGPATYSKLLAETLPSYGIQVAVVPFSLVRFLPKGIRHFAYFFVLLTRAVRTGLIYAQDAVSVGFPAALVAAITRKRFWLRVPGDHAWEQGVARYGVKEPLEIFVHQVSRYPLAVRLLTAIERSVARRAERIIVPSEYLKTIVVAWGVEAAKVCVLYNTPTLPTSLSSKEALRTQLGVQGRLIVSAGRLVPWKGFTALIEAVARLRAEFPDIVLAIAGDGEERKSLEDLIRKAGLSQQVVLKGKLPQRELHALIKAADVFALNTFYEGLSHQLLEAMALGTPVVTTSAGGNRELIDDEVEGLIVRYNDVDALAAAIGRLLTDKALAQRLSSCAGERASAFAKRDPVGELAALLAA